MPSIEKHGLFGRRPNVNEGRSLEEVLGEYLGVGAHLELRMDWTKLKSLQTYPEGLEPNWKIFLLKVNLKRSPFSFAHKDTIARNFQNNIAVIDLTHEHALQGHTY